MDQIAQVIALIIKHFPLLEGLFMRAFKAYMAKQHAIDVSRFIAAEADARKTKSTKELQKIIGRRLK